MACGQQPSRRANRRNFKRTLLHVLGMMAIPETLRYSSRAFRRGDTQELRETCSGWPAIASVGFLDPPAIAGYVDLAPEVERRVRQLFIDACEPDESVSSSPEEQYLSIARWETSGAGGCLWPVRRLAHGYQG